MDTQTDLSRLDSTNYSTTDFGGHQDPYAVPPLPHLNPNQPYRDDPNSTAAYYDPYRGPAPATAETGQHWEGEAIPMNQMQPQPAGRQSPGPYQAYDQGRASPGPQNMGGYQTYDHYDPNAAAQNPYAGGPAPQQQVPYGQHQQYPGGAHGQGPPGY